MEDFVCVVTRGVKAAAAFAVSYRLRAGKRHALADAEEKWRQTLFPQHQDALRANGSVDSVQRLTQKDLLAFRDRYIGAKNGVIFVFGDVKAADVKALFEKALDSMKPGMLALTDIHPATPLGGTEAVESRKDKAQGVLMV